MTEQNWNCARCNQQNPNTNAFCGKCGAARPVTALPPEPFNMWLVFGIVGGLVVLGLVFALVTPRAPQSPPRSAEPRASDKPRATILEEVGRYNDAMDKADPGKHFHLRAEYNFTSTALHVTVPNSWHYRPYQERLQAAQLLWNVWAKMHSPAKPDEAYISVVDSMGNEVGGSRMWGGSLIWVQEK